jgi:hypothetical protein
MRRLTRRPGFGLLVCALVLAVGSACTPAGSPRPGVPQRTPTAPPQPGAHTLWSANQETGDLSQWSKDRCGGEFNSGTGKSSITTAVAHSGRYAAQMSITAADQATQGVRLFRWCESDRYEALYYSAWFYFPQQVRVRGWSNLMQWKSDGSFNPKFALRYANRADGQMYLYLGRGQDSGGGQWLQSLTNIPVRRWFHLEAYYRKANNKTGRITVWQDGVQIIHVTNIQTANGTDLDWSVNNYGDGLDPSAVTIYVDDASISVTRVGPAAAPAASGASARDPRGITHTM